jgi:hypothetical protein
LWNLKQKVYPGLCKVTETSRNEHAPRQQSLLVLRQGTQLLSKQNVPYTPGCMLSKADADEPAERRKSSALGHQTLADIIPQDKQLWNWVVQVMKGWEGTPPDYLHLYQ